MHNYTVQLNWDQGNEIVTATNYLDADAPGTAVHQALAQTPDAPATGYAYAKNRDTMTHSFFTFKKDRNTVRLTTTDDPKVKARFYLKT